MARRKGFFAAMAQAAREAERERQAQQRAQMRAVRAREQAVRAHERARAADARESKRMYAEARAEEAAALDAEVASHREALDTVLEATLGVDDHIDLDALKEPAFIPPFDPGPDGTEAPPPDPTPYVVAPLSMGQRFIPGAKSKHEQLTQARKDQFEVDTASWAAEEGRRKERLAKKRASYEAEVVEINARTAARHAEIDRIKAELEERNGESVKNYFELVLTSSSWPDGFPQQCVLAYDADSRLLGIDYVLPDWSVVPEAKGYKYVRANDRIEAISETQAKRRALYANVVAQSALRVLHEVFEADRRGLSELDGPDHDFYRAWFQDVYTVVRPLGSGEMVTRAVPLLRGSALLRGLVPYGIIDRDFHPDSMIAVLPDGVEALPVHEIESLYCIPAVVGAVARHLGKTFDEAAYVTRVRGAINTVQRDAVVIERWKQKVEGPLLDLVGQVSSRATDLATTLTGVTATFTQSNWAFDPAALLTDEKASVEALVPAGPISEILRLMPGKSLISLASTYVGLNKDDYRRLVNSALQGSGMDQLEADLVAALSPYLPARTA